jgi:zona occludens toxin (predicted ATPase)
LFSGTPGSGKTLHAVEEGLAGMRRRGGVIANFPITNPRHNKDGTSKWIYKSDDELTPEYLMERAKEWDHIQKESQALVIVDEAHRILNSRTWDEDTKGRLRLLRFLSEHRHFGYDIILIAQADRMLDRQSRPLVETETKHFKLNQRWWWLPIPIFLRVEKWYGMQGMKGKVSFSLFPIGKGRYDHMGMRRLIRGTGTEGPPSRRASVGRRGGDDLLSEVSVEMPQTPVADTSSLRAAESVTTPGAAPAVVGDAVHANDSQGRRDKFATLSARRLRRLGAHR